MDTILVIVALSFIAIGAYGAFVLPRSAGVRTAGSRRGGGTAIFHAAFASSRKPRETTTRVKEQRRPGPPTINSIPVVGGLPRPAMNQPGASIVREVRRPAEESFSEVDLLRAQVDELRSEIAALSSTSGGSAGPRYERPHMRRTSVGIYTHLPSVLRRQVREARSVRRSLTR